MEQMNQAPWQKMAGLQPATKQARVLLDELQRCAVEIIKIAELEKNGIHGGAAFDAAWMKCSRAFSELEEYYKYEREAGRKAALAKYFEKMAAEDAVSHAPSPR